MTVNSAQGLAFEIPPVFLQRILEAGRQRNPQCKVTLDDLYLTGLALDSPQWKQSISSLDAVAIAYVQSHSSEGN
jgi:hypothetical protein